MADLESLLKDLPELMNDLKLNIGGNFSIQNEIVRLDNVQSKIKNIESEIQEELEFESFKNQAIGVLSWVTPVAAFFIPGGFIADILLSGAIAGFANKFGDPEQEMSMTDLLERIDNLIDWGDFLKETAKTLSVNSNFLGYLQNCKYEMSLPLQFNAIKNDSLIALNLKNINILRTQLQRIKQSQQKLIDLEKLISKTSNKLNNLTDDDDIFSIVVTLIPYFGNTVFSLEWFDDEEGLIISHGQRTIRLIDIMEDCQELEKNIHSKLDKVNHLLMKAEQVIKDHEEREKQKEKEALATKSERQDRVIITNSQPSTITYAKKITTSTNDNSIYKRIVQFISVGLILAGVYSVGWLTRGKANQIPQSSPNPVVNSQ